MKWFHHDCAARSDLKLQTLGTRLRAEGLGIYWGLLEELGRGSDCFRLKLSELSAEADAAFRERLDRPKADREHREPEWRCVPVIPLDVLARNLFTTPQKLLSVIRVCTGIGLFDSREWESCHLLYSALLEERADEYTRKIRRSKAVSPDMLRIESRGRPEQTEIDIGETAFAVAGTPPTPAQPVEPGHMSQEEAACYARKIRQLVEQYNQGRGNRFCWNPTYAELESLLTGGGRDQRARACLQAMNLLGGDASYGELVLRAVRLMLRASQKRRITNPTGWLMASLRGGGPAGIPWAAYATAEEECQVPHMRRSAVVHTCSS